MFFTEVDPRAAVTGSRDPLGLVTLWASHGRSLIGNLTTITTSVREFATLLGGICFASDVIERFPTASRTDAVLVYEQAVAYGLLASGNRPGRGVQRAEQRWRSSSFDISAKPRDQILSRQASYGVLGLFLAASRESGLVERKGLALTPKGLEVVDCPAWQSARSSDAWAELVTRAGHSTAWHLSNRNSRGVAALATLAAPVQAEPHQACRGAWDESLVDGGADDRTKGLQSVLASVLPARKDSAPTSADLRNWAHRLLSKGDLGLQASELLSAAADLNALLAPSAVLFDFLRLHDGQLISSVVAALKQEWGTSGRDTPIPELGLLEPSPEGARAAWQQVAAALSNGDWEAALRATVVINREVMQVRAGGDWVTIGTDDRIRVRYLPEPVDLPLLDDVATSMQGRFFFDSLWRISDELRAS